MPNEIKWNDGSYTELIAGDASTPTLKNLASGSNKLGSELDNSGGNLYAHFELQTRGAAAYGAGQHIELTFILAPDGTNYEDGADGTDPAKGPDVVFPVRAVDTQQRIVVRNVMLPTGKFKPLINNTADQAFTNTNDENVLSYMPFNPEVQ